ncbi:hypothetical protein [Nisaea sediminum]|uniref:hypothetical protein n=1 Tax=Nisaea sediminum TaxID=2775867 RepID=UPI001867BE69|nr:hypothetical protein [Nisaea sediminum]
MRILERLEEAYSEWGGYLNMRALTDDVIDRDLARALVRGLAAKGQAKFARGLWTEDGEEPAGSGYTITAAGRARLKKMEGAAG